MAKKSSYTAEEHHDDVQVASALTAGGGFGSGLGLATGITLMRSGKQQHNFTRFGVGTGITVVSTLAFALTAGILYVINQEVKDSRS
jgi:hypothetical protein